MDPNQWTGENVEFWLISSYGRNSVIEHERQVNKTTGAKKLFGLS